MSPEKCINLTGELMYALVNQDCISEVGTLHLYKTKTKKLNKVLKNGQTIEANKIDIPKL